MNDFIEFVKNSGSNFNADSEICIISHHDTDGLCSAAILEKVLERENKQFTTYNLQQLDELILNEISKQYNYFIFADIGSTSIDLIDIYFKDKFVWILDHHKPNQTTCSNNIIHINPFLFDLTEENLISGSGVTYFFAQGINSKNKDLAYLGVLGAIGDTQADNKGFKELNNIILQHAILQKQITIIKELKLYGKNSRPLTKVLEYSSDINIPGLTNNYKGVIAFLRNLNIPLYWNQKPRKWFNLKPYEKDAITQSILNLKSDVDPEEITINNYILNVFNKRELKIARECATIINSCGRLEDFRTAIDALKQDEQAQEKAVMNLRLYKNSIRNAIELFESYKEQNNLLTSNRTIIFDANENVKSNLIGVISSIIARNKYYDSNKIICGLAKNDENTVKISLRASQDTIDIDLSQLLNELLAGLDATSGGHPNAAGAIINIDKKQEFIDKLLNVN